MHEDPTDESSPIEKHVFRILRHQLLGKMLEIVLTPVDITVESEVQVMSAPPKADLLLLRRNGRRWSKEQRKLLPDGIRDRQARHHLLECKFSESLNADALQQALGYDYFYRQTQRIREAELQTYVVSAKTPQTTLLGNLGYRAVEQPGVYVTTLDVMQRVVVLVLNELRDEPQNEFLRLFASRKLVRQQTIDHVFQQPAGELPEPLLAVIFGLQRLYQMEGTAMNQEMTVDDVMKMGRDLRKQVLASASPAERLAGMTPEEHLAGMDLEKFLASLAPEQRLAGMTPEEMVILRERLDALLTKQSADKPQH